MIRKTFLPVLAVLMACDVTQELQGGELADGGGSTPTVDGGGSGTSDAGVTPSTDSGTSDSAVTRQASICTPQSAIGTTTVAVTGVEGGMFHNVTDLAAGAGRVFALSAPWTFVGVPAGGGPAVGYDLSGTLPNFISMAIVKTDTNPSGTLTSKALAVHNLPTGGGQLLALRGGATGTALEVAGKIIIDQDDVYYFTKQAPSQLVHASTKSNVTEQLLVEYPTASNTVVTAAAPLGAYVYFASYTQNGLSKTSMLHRIPKTGGVVEDLAPMTSWGDIGDIYQDGNLLYATPGPRQSSAATTFAIYSLQTGTATSGRLQGSSDAVANIRATGVAYDGTSFYYGASPGGGGCNGQVVRVSKAIAVAHSAGKVDVLATNLDLPVRILADAGALYVGTAGDPFFKPVGYPGQMLRWTP